MPSRGNEHTGSHKGSIKERTMQIYINREKIEKTHHITLPKWADEFVQISIEGLAVFIARGKRAALLSLSPQEARRIFH